MHANLVWFKFNPVYNQNKYTKLLLDTICANSRRHNAETTHKTHRHLCSVHFHMYNISRMKNIKSLTFQKPAKTNTWTCSRFNYSYFKPVPLTTASSRNKWKINDGWKLNAIRLVLSAWCGAIISSLLG